ncbi:MAG: benzoate-CoA ligase family protein [Proteobacteria bacterium]|nr:benzoate-CoA ligase family protein [Pseudomonadota bacterium]
MKEHDFSVLSQGEAPEIHFSPIFNAAVPFIDHHLEENRGDKVVIRTTRGEQVTYQQLADRVNCCGNLFSDLGLQRSDRIMMVVKDCPEFFYIFWGAIKAGFIPVPVNTLLRANDLSYMMLDSGSDLLVYSPEYQDEVKIALSLINQQPQQIICVEGDKNSLQLQLSNYSRDLQPVATSAEDECFLLYTSGSTGNPKGVVHCHEDLVYPSQYYGVDLLHINEKDLIYSAPKLFFAYGLGNAMLYPLWVGASVVLFDGRPTAESTFKIIEEYQPTCFFGVPTLYGLMLQEVENISPSMSSLRECISAGEALPPALFQRWREKTGISILDCIGSTEVVGLFISNRPEDIREGSTGKPVPGTKVIILDEKGKEMKRGESGSLFIKAPSLFKCYWNLPDKTKAAFVDGWFNTGDTYSQDEDGYYIYCGRSDDMLKIGGIWCSPFEIESTLTEHPQVLQTAVVGHPDREGLIKPKAFIVLKDRTLSEEEMQQQLLQLCKDKLAHYKYPRWFVFQDEVPKTATGKIQRFKLRKQS